MAGWISSKLKVAETFLQQIDQQAAESLGGKNEEFPQSHDDGGIPKKPEPLPLKFQLPNKLRIQPSNDPPLHHPTTLSRPVAATSNPAAGDGDWTQLLSSSTTLTTPFSSSHKNSSRPTRRKSGTTIIPGNENSKRLSLSGDEAAPSSSSSSDSTSGDPILSAVSRGSPDLSDSVSDAAGKSGLEIYRKAVQKGEDDSQEGGAVGEVGIVEARVWSGLAGGDSSSVSKTRSDSGTDSGSGSGSASSDSENESERRIERRKRREKMVAERAAAMAIAAIKERENNVARLEGEKQSLEKILQERQKLQAQEASELQTSMMETMEAVDLEKQKHNSTRMEALARLAQHETINAGLARSLAATQWNLEAEVNRVSELRQQNDLKELALKELRRKLSKIHQTAPSLNQMEGIKRAKYEQELLEAESSFVCEKIGQMKEKARKIEQNIEVTRIEMVYPTEIEAELKKRLEQLTDHLIQKQAQVEALTSEKATLLFRIETTLRLLEENGLSEQPASSGLGSAAEPLSRVDIEAGTRESFHSAASRPLLLRGRKRHLGSFFLQLDAIFSAGAMFLRRNPAAQVWSFVYLVCLHLWVIYIILMSHSQASDGATTAGAVFSLENIIINKTSSS